MSFCEEELWYDDHSTQHLTVTLEQGITHALGIDQQTVRAGVTQSCVISRQLLIFCNDKSHWTKLNAADHKADAMRRERNYLLF